MKAKKIDLETTIGANIKYYIAINHTSNKELAHLLGWSKSKYYSLMANVNKLSIEQLKLIAFALHVDFYELIKKDCLNKQTVQ